MMGCTRIITFLGMCSMASQEPTWSRNNFKGLTGVNTNSEVTAGVRRVVYYHDQAVAVVDVNREREIQNCDIIEV